MPQQTEPAIDFANAIAAIAKDRFVDRLWQRDGTLFCESEADQVTARSARDGMGWLFDTQALRDAVEPLAILARVVERLRYDRVVVLAPPPIAAWCDAVGRHLKGKRGLPLVALWGDTAAQLATALDEGKAAKPLWILIATADSPRDAIQARDWLGKDRCPPDNCVAVAPLGSELDRLARTAEFRERFALPADVGARFAAVSMATLVPAALAGVVLHDALTRAEDMLDQCRDLAPDLNPGVRLGTWLWVSGQSRRTLYLSLSKDCRGFSDWVAHVAAVPGVACLWPTVAPRAAAEPAWWLQRAPHSAVVSVSTFAHPDDPCADAARSAEAPDESFVLPEPADWWAEAVRWQFALATWGRLARRNPFAAQARAPEPTDAAQSVRLAVQSIAGLPRALADQLAELGSGDRVLVAASLPVTAANQQRVEALRDALASTTTAAVAMAHGNRWPAAAAGPLAGDARGLLVRLDDNALPSEGALNAGAAPGWQTIHAFLASLPEPA